MNTGSTVRALRHGLAFLFLAALLAAALPAQRWEAVGPDGGDVRSLAQDPSDRDRLFLGTSAGQLYISSDFGRTWRRYARLGEADDYVLDHIVIDPRNARNLYVSAWSVENRGGGVFHSRDGGQKWERLEEMDGKSVRALAMAPSDSNTLVAGALDGVFRSDDGGRNWRLISPAHHAELKNIESVAIDPINPDVVYAGTWHLPWKTSDGGKTWVSIKKGLIVDSDVFSIIVDPQKPAVVYLSACSGIYKSETAGELFHKIQGMPFSARRTRVLRQDPMNLNVIYAGTTEGLWKSEDAGATWRRTTGPNLIINDVLVDPRNSQRILMATDRSGVLASDNGGWEFTASNRGFTYRQVASVLVERSEPDTIFAAVINDKEFGGVFVTRDAGGHWSQMSAGLDGRDVFVLRQSQSGLLVAGTNSGIFIAHPREGIWRPADLVVSPLATPRGKPGVGLSGWKHGQTPRTRAVGSLARARVPGLAMVGGKWFAATSAGLFVSSDEGQSWRGGPLLGHTDIQALYITPQVMAAASRKALLLSLDGGERWYSPALPEDVTSIADVAVDAGSNVWFAAREGAFRSHDGGDTWERLKRLPINHLASLFYDGEANRVVVASRTSTELFETVDGGHTWRRADTGWLLRTVSGSHGRLLATTPFDGVIVQPDNHKGREQAVAGGAQQ